MKYTDSAKVKLKLGIEVLQKYGREGTLIADELLKETPVDSEGFDREGFLREVERRLEDGRGSNLITPLLLFSIPLFLMLFAATVTTQDRIVFERRLNTNTWDIFLMNADGSFPRNLTNGPENKKNLEPAISPDGKRMVFSSDRAGFLFELYVMELGGLRTVRQITHDISYINHSPKWSPDGSHIVYAQCGPSRTMCDIVLINADGTNPTPICNSPQDDDGPRFSPDGTQIIFASNRGGNYDIYRCNVNGLNVQQLAINPANDTWPTWSPDGERIVFSSMRNGSNYDLYTMNADGSNVLRLTQGNGMHNIQAVFSSDGRRLAWMRPFGSNTYEIVEAPIEAMNPPRRLTLNTIHDVSPDYRFVTRKVGRR